MRRVFIPFASGVRIAPMDMTSPRNATMNDVHALVAQSPLFRCFSQEIIAAMVPLFKPCHFDADSVICPKGGESDCMYIIHEGQAEISLSSRDGKIIVLGTLGPGEVFGEIGLLDRGERTASVDALTDLSLYRLSAADFEKLSQSFSLNEWIAITRYICGLFRTVASNLEDTVFLDTDERILRRLLDLYEKSADKPADGSYEAHISQENLGRMTNLSREATNKALSRLSKLGLIERRYKHIFIPDISRIRAALDGAEI